MKPAIENTDEMETATKIVYLRCGNNTEVILRTYHIILCLEQNYVYKNIFIRQQQFKYAL